MIQNNKIQALEQIKNFHSLTEEEVCALENFVEFLLQENEKFNFIGKSTIDDLWNRHILDSAQLLQFIDNKNLKFADFGTGAGFPGMVLSILGVKEMHLVEKSFRKADFLRKSREFSPNKIFVSQKDLREMEEEKFDVIVSRALAPLPKLLDYSTKFLKKDGYCLFLKGRKIFEEIEVAKKDFNFDFAAQSSLTSSESRIIKITNIQKIN